MSNSLTHRPLVSALCCALAAPCAWSLQTQDAPTGAGRRLLPNAAFATAPAVETALDDSVPLPVDAVYEPSADGGGDVLVAPASGDPYFLGFVAGKHFPPAGERIDPQLSDSLLSHYADGRPTQETYAFVMFQKRITSARLEALRDLGVRVIEFHPHYTMKVALAPALVDQVAALDFVRWVGAPRTWQKVHPVLTRELENLKEGELAEVYISVFDSDLCDASVREIIGRAVTVDENGALVEDPDDSKAAARWMSNGWQQRALEALGADVTEYVDSIRAFRAKIAPAALELLVGQDFVQFVEADLPPELMSAAAPHEESIPMITTDRTRASYTGGTSSFAVGGIADSGVKNTHSDLSIFGVGWNFTGSGSMWDDGCGHGSHVAGTMFGRGFGEARKRGNAPGLGWGGTGRIFNARIFNDTCGYSGSSLASIMDVLNSPFTDGGGATTPAPHVINHSWGTSGGPYSGTEADARTIDNEVHNNAQMHVWAAGNQGNNTAGSLLLQAAAKNAFTVGNVLSYRDAIGDPGTLWSSSSTGPAGDGRWKPNVTAPGRWISSVDSATSNGYTDKSGTSMAAPHVAGLAAQLLDHYNWLGGWPEATAALLMASATTKDNQVITSQSSVHLDTYGAGRVQGWRAHFPSAQTAWYVWNFGLNNTSTNGDFAVNSGATRVVVCMFYSEPAASSGASQALVNNYDLYIDQPPLDTAANNTGEWVAQQSSINNCEIRIIDNPGVFGTWRWKIFNQSTTGNVYTGVAVQVIYGDTTPDGTQTLTASDIYVQPNDNVTLTASVSNPSTGAVASALFLDSTSSGDTLQSATVVLEDGVSASLADNEHAGRDVLLGDIIPGDSKSISWVTRWATEGAKLWSVNARSDNWISETDSLTVYVDGTPPALPTNLVSTSHTVNVWSNDNTVDFTWTASTDNVSGVDGYGEAYGSVQPVGVANAKDMEEVTSFTRTMVDGTWYWALRPVDNSGNWQTTNREVGPYRIDTAAPTQPGVISSTTHPVNVQQCGTTVTVNWAASSDSLSGLAGYRGVWDTNPTTDPTGATNISAASTSYALNIGSSTTPRYFHLRALDNAGNWSATRHYGPVLANANSVVIYCTGKVNSLGCTPAIGTNGVQPDKSNGNFTVTCTNVLNQKFGLLFWGFAPLSTPFQGGTLCVASPTIRTASLSSGGASSGNSCTGSYAFTFSTAYLNANGINPGQTLYGQWWMRDPASPSTTGLSNAVRFTVCQ